MKQTFLFFIQSVSLFLCGGVSSVAEQPNILFIAIDDLRPELACYGSGIAVTPNLDKLASEGLLFNRAYCQQAICGPSRASLMSGLRPDTSGVVHNGIKLREITPDLVTVSQHFAKNGYESVYCGKIFHGKDTDEELSWSRKPVSRELADAVRERPFVYAEPAETVGDFQAENYPVSQAWSCRDVPDDKFSDGASTNFAIATMLEMVEQGEKPFFLGLGFKKPHLNWDAPKRYWDYYQRESIPLATQVEPPVDGAAMGLHASFELRTRDGMPKQGDFDLETARTLKHAYLACVSYVDAQIGRAMATLEEAGIRDNTIVIVWSDHGWHLGEMGIWGKATNYELGTRVPLLISAPSLPEKYHGTKTDALVELIDMYPTLCDLAGIEIPSVVEGHSFKPLLSDPTQPWKTAAFSQFPCPALREWAAMPLSPKKRKTFFGPSIEEVEARIIAQQGERWDRELFEKNLTGYTMRTDRHRLVLWKDVKNPEAEPIWVEVFDHQEDPLETKNIAPTNPELVKTLTARFNEGWKASLPANK